MCLLVHAKAVSVGITSPVVLFPLFPLKHTHTYMHPYKDASASVSPAVHASRVVLQVVVVKKEMDNKMDTHTHTHTTYPKFLSCSWSLREQIIGSWQ